jgi:hypothetical protein
MSGISSISSGSSSSLPNGGLSSVGASLLNSGSAPNAVPAAGTPSSTGLSTYQTQFANLQQYDDQELLYASFLSPSDSLANGNEVLEQAAALLGSPGHPGTLATSEAAATPAATTTAPASSSSSSTSSTSGALSNIPSVASILAASDDEAQQTLTAYSNAPVGSSILDFQA